MNTYSQITRNRLENALYPALTTSGEYKELPLGGFPKTVYKGKIKRRQRFAENYGVHPETIKPFVKYLPFTLYVDGDPIIKSNIHDVDLSTTYVVPEDIKQLDTMSRENRKTIYMVPQVSLDSIKDEKTKKMLQDYTYTSSYTLSNNNIKDFSKNRFAAPLANKFSPTHPIVLPSSHMPYVSPEWRMESLSWERNALRCHFDSTKEFWLRYRKPNTFGNQIAVTEIIKA